MMRLSNLIKIFVFAILLLFFAAFYNFQVGKLSVTLLDEYFWVGRSYFFEKYITGDWYDGVWYQRNSYDQPKLAEYLYGVQLYPYYIKDGSPSYIEFLAQNGFAAYDSGTELQETYETVDLDPFAIDLDKPHYLNTPNAYQRVLNLIYISRTINVFLLILSLICAFYIARMYLSYHLSLLFVVFLGLNNLLVSSGVRAHSEGLFILLYSASILTMFLWFKTNKNLFLVLLAIFAGLCMSTKLNGIMLPFIFFINSILLSLIYKKSHMNKALFQSILVIGVSIVVFVLLNPITHINGISGLINIFSWRFNVATYYQAQDFQLTYLANNGERLVQIFENHFFSPNVLFFNSPLPIGQPYWYIYSAVIFVLFCLGLLSITKNAFLLEKEYLLLLVTFLQVIFYMSYYLVLNWDRYYVPLVLFFTLTEFIGAKYLFKKYLGNML